MKLLPQGLCDEMYMKSLWIILPPEFSDVMITSVVCTEEVRQEMQIRQITRDTSARVFLM